MASATILPACCVAAMFLQLCTACYDVQASLTLVPLPSPDETICPLVGFANARGFSVEMRYRGVHHNSTTVDNWVLLNTLTEGIYNYYTPHDRVLFIQES